MTDNTKYNGWANYPTWNVNLWIDNEQGEQEYWEERAADTWENATPRYDWETKKDVAVSDLADELKDYHEERATELVKNAGMFSDILGWALEVVDWREIATTMIETAAEDNPEESEEEESEEE
jgi:hypothetical protein